MAIRFACNACQTPLSIDESKAGLAVACPKCGARLQVPSVQTTLPPPAPMPAEPAPGRADDMPREPHRGVLILVLGIVSAAVAVLSLLCGIFFAPVAFVGILGIIPGILAWIFGQQDIAKIRAGTMDPTGEGMVNGGRICGIVGTIVQGTTTLCCGVVMVGSFFMMDFMGQKANMTFQTVGQSLTASGGK